MIIVHVGEYVSGGVATYLQNLISQQCLDPKVSKVYLISSKYGSQQLEINSPKFTSIVYMYHRSIKGIFTILKLWRKILQLNPDVVHLHSTFAGLCRISLPIKRDKSIRVVYCAHGWSFLTPRSRLKKCIYALVEKILSYRTDAIINISKFEQHGAERIGIQQRRLFLVPNAITLKNTIPKPIKTINELLRHEESGLKILYVGRFDKYKGLDILLSAFNKLNRRSTLILAGRPVLDDSIKIPRSTNIINLGWRSEAEVAWLMQSIDIVVIPSRAEGFGLVAFEAFFNNAMVVSSDVGGLPELVIDKVTGRTFTSENVDELATILNEVNERDIEQYTYCAQKFVKSLGNASDMEKKILWVYQNV